MNNILTKEILVNIGKTEPSKKELVTKRDIRKYAVATGQRQKKYLDGNEAPPMFHISLFWDVVTLEELNADGISIDSLVPEFPLKKSMAGGWKIEYHKPIFAGDWLTATRTLTDIYEKVGSSGPLIFYEITTIIENDKGEKVITEVNTRILR